MLAAVVEDLARCPGVETTTLLHPTLLSSAACWPAGVRVELAGEDAEGRFRALAAAADWTLVIAPEFDGILEQRCRLVEESGGRLLGPSAAAVWRTADKLELSRWFRDAVGVPTPPALALPCAGRPPWPLPWVCKPRDGAGSQATFLVEREEALLARREQARAEGWQGEMIVQPCVRGQAASVACLVGPGRCVTLPAAEQRLSSDGCFHYEGGTLPLLPPLDQRAQRLAERAVQAVPGLLGYVGVDLVLGDAADGSGDAVIEINPRLTTSYVGLRRLARFNLAEALLAIATGNALPRFAWRRGPVRFFPDGRVTE